MWETGPFWENLVVEGPDFRSRQWAQSCTGTGASDDQIGKECHSHCAYKRMGECIMPREGVFAKVLKGRHHPPW